MASKRVLIVTSLEVVGQESRQQGSPVSFEDGFPVPAENAPSAAGPTSLGPRPSGPVVAAGGGGGGAAGGGGGGGGGPQCVPVAHLNPYVNRWTIKVRVTNKGTVREFNNAKGPGKLFSCDLLDERGDEIRCTFFGRAVDSYYNLLEKDGVYYMGQGKLKVANKQYTSIKHEYEITFDEKSTITPAPADARIARVQYNFVKLARLEDMPANAPIDVLGVVVNPGAPADLTSKAGKQLRKRDVALGDDSGIQVTVTLWGEKADM